MNKLIHEEAGKRTLRVGTHVLTNESELTLSHISNLGWVDLSFVSPGGYPWAMNRKAVAELIELLTEIKDAMEG